MYLDLLVLIVVLGCGSCQDRKSSSGHYSVGYQIHSNNDLNEWDQLLNKGAIRFKVDVHYLAGGTNCAEKGYDSECFLLSHDTPDKQYISYNSSDDLVQFLTFHCQDLRPSTEEIVVSLCFKSAPDKCDESSTAFSAWLTMVDSLYDTLTSQPPDNMQFVLDGDAKPENCLVGRWPLWNSVWIQGSSPDEALYSNEGEYGRFQVLNDREGKLDWYKLAREDYGKFTNSTAPYHLWEPDAQSDFHEYIKIYESGKEHAPGFCFAINIDIAMFNVFTTPVTGALPDPSQLTLEQSTSVNVQLVGEESASRPHIVPLYADNGGLLELFLYLFQDDSHDSDALLFSTLEVSRSALSKEGSRPQSGGALPLPNSTWLLDSDSAEVAGVSSTQGTADAPAFLLVTASSGRFCLYFYSGQTSAGVGTDDMMLVPRACSVFSDLSGDVFDAALISCESGAPEGSLCALVISADAQGNRLLLSTHSLLPSSDQSTAFTTTRRSSVQLTHFKGITAEVSSARLAVGESGVFVFAAVDHLLFGTTMSVGGVAAGSADPSAWTAMGVGRSVDVSTGPGGVLLLVTDYGFCYNSHKHNTRSTEKVCSSVPKPSEHVLDYTLGLERDWADYLSAAGATADRSSDTGQHEGLTSSFVTPCHRRLLHGSFDQGARPSVALSALSSAPPVFLELHEGLSRGARADGACGNPMHRGGLILDSFPIDEWISNLKR